MRKTCDKVTDFRQSPPLNFRLFGLRKGEEAATATATQTLSPVNTRALLKLFNNKKLFFLQLQRKDQTNRIAMANYEITYPGTPIKIWPTVISTYFTALLYSRKSRSLVTFRVSLLLRLICLMPVLCAFFREGGCELIVPEVLHNKTRNSSVRVIYDRRLCRCRWMTLLRKNGFCFLYPLYLPSVVSVAAFGDELRTYSECNWILFEATRFPIPCNLWPILSPLAEQRRRGL